MKVIKAILEHIDEMDLIEIFFWVAIGAIIYGIFWV